MHALFQWINGKMLLVKFAIGLKVTIVITFISFHSTFKNSFETFQSVVILYRNHAFKLNVFQKSNKLKKNLDLQKSWQLVSSLIGMLPTKALVHFSV